MLHKPRSNGRENTVPVGAESGPSLFAEAEDTPILSLQDLFRVLWRRRWVIALVTVVLTGMAVAFTLAQTPMYEASIKILVGQERGIAENPSNAGDLQQITQTMAEGISSRSIAEAVIQELNLQTTPEDFIDEHLSVKQIGETQYIRVGYRDSSPERAQQIANTIGEVYSEEISQVSSSASSITATVWDQAVVPKGPVSPNPVRNGLLALVLGLMLGGVLAFVFEYLDLSWRSPEEVERITGVPNFGVIPAFGIPTDKKERS